MQSSIVTGGKDAVLVFGWKSLPILGLFPCTSSRGGNSHISDARVHSVHDWLVELGATSYGHKQIVLLLFRNRWPSVTGGAAHWPLLSGTVDHSPSRSLLQTSVRQLLLAVWIFSQLSMLSITKRARETDRQTARM